MLAVAVLKAQQYGTRAAPVNQCGARRCKPRRFGEAGTAAYAGAAIDLERRAAAGAHWCGDEGKVGPAAGAEAALDRNDLPAGRAARRQQDIKDKANPATQPKPYCPCQSNPRQSNPRHDAAA